MNLCRLTDRQVLRRGLAGDDLSRILAVDDVRSPGWTLVKPPLLFWAGQPKIKLKIVVAEDMVPFIFCSSEIKLESPAVGRNTYCAVALQRLQRY
jgi:hypothetical protein